MQIFTFNAKFTNNASKLFSSNIDHYLIVFVFLCAVACTAFLKMSEFDEPSVHLVSQEGALFDVPLKAAKLSKFICTMVDDELFENETPELPMVDVKSAALSKVTEFMIHYVDHPFEQIQKPLMSSNIRDVVPDWYADFIDVEHQLLFDLILAANYLDIKPLLDLTCATVASMVREKTPNEIKDHFGIQGDPIPDLTEEEEEKLKAENQWCLEV